ncbi:MAG TPA: uroporphyrinogen-III synthase [Pyrinomonadaceae bacterium]|jgi:uroporphyrinogen-III synthase
MTVLVVRRDDNFSQMLRDAGIEVINFDLIATEVLKDLGEFENLIPGLDGYAGIFFTSPVAARVFVDKVEPSLQPTLYALGHRASAVLIEAGFAVKTITEANTAEEMLTAFGDDEFAGKKLLFVRGERSMRTVPDRIGGIAKVDEVAVYRTVEIDPGDGLVKDVRERLASAKIEWTCFFSPSAVEAFVKRFVTLEVRTAAIGETTAARARDLGFKVELIASGATNEVFAGELIKRIRRV